VSPAAARLRVFTAAALFSTGGAAFKLCGFTGWQVAGLRGAVAALVVLALVPAARGTWSWRLGLVGCAYAATTILFVQANKLTTAASAVFLEDASPVFVLVLGPLLLRERARRSDLVFLAAALCGMAFFFLGVEPPRATATNPVLGNLLSAVSSVTFAFTVIGYRWLAHHTGGGAGSVAAALVSGNLTAFVFSLPWALPIAAGAPRDWVVIAYLGIVQLGLGYVVLAQAVPHATALDVSLLLLLEPVLNPIWAWLVHREVPGVWSVAGGGIILGAVAVKVWSDSRRLDVR